MISPITPPPELVQQWFKQARESADPDNQLSYYDFISTAAAQWGQMTTRKRCYHLLLKQYGMHFKNVTSTRKTLMNTMLGPLFALLRINWIMQIQPTCYMLSLTN
jgi:hypothetical protein